MPHRIDPNALREKWTDVELMKARFKPIEWLIPNLLPVGLSVLAGRPFAGKSFLALQAASALNHGGIFLNEKAKQGKVLYLSLENRNVDLRERMKTIGWEPTGQVDIFTGWPRFKEGGMGKLKKQLEEGDYLFCVIDSLYKLLSGSKIERDSQMEPLLTELYNFCKRGVIEALLFLYHTNKISIQIGEGDESAVMGDTSISGVPDNLWMLWHKPQSRQIMFHRQGREMKAVSKPIKFDDVTCTWQLITKKDQIRSDSIRGLVLEQFEMGGEAQSATRIAERIHKPVSLIRAELLTLATNNLLKRLPRQGVEVFYELPVVPVNPLPFLQ